MHAEAVAHLLRLGYTRIGMLNGPNVSTSRRRFVGYQQALKAWRRRVDPQPGRCERFPGRGGLRERNHAAAPPAGCRLRRKLSDGGRVACRRCGSIRSAAPRTSGS